MVADIFTNVPKRYLVIYYFAEQSSHAGFLFDYGMQFVYGDALLLHSVAVAYGDGAVFEALVIDCDAQRGAYGVVAAVAFADTVLFVVRDVEVEFEIVYYLLSHFGQSVFLDEGQHRRLDRG